MPESRKFGATKIGAIWYEAKVWGGQTSTNGSPCKVKYAKVPAWK